MTAPRTPALPGYETLKRINLEELERKAKAVTQESWTQGDSSLQPERAAHIAANSPGVTLALVAWIRQLRAELAQVDALLEGAIGVVEAAEKVVCGSETVDYLARAVKTAGLKAQQ